MCNKSVCSDRRCAPAGNAVVITVGLTMAFWNKADVKRCSFCDKSSSEVQRLVAREGAAICGGCTLLTVYSVLRDTEPQEEEWVHLASALEPYGTKQDKRPYPQRFHDMVSAVLGEAVRVRDNH